MRRFRNMVSLTRSTWSGVPAERGDPSSLLTFTDRSLHHFDAARRITSLKLLPETTLCSCNRLCFDKQFHWHNAVLHGPALTNRTTHITGHNDDKYGSAA
jgi:hypothetical protein